MRRRWFNDPALYTLLAVMFGLHAQIQAWRGNYTLAFLNVGNGLLIVLVAVCFAIMQGSRDTPTHPSRPGPGHAVFPFTQGPP